MFPNIGVESGQNPNSGGLGTITPTLFVFSGDTRFSLIHLIADILQGYVPENVSCLNFCRTLSIIFEFYFDASEEKKLTNEKKKENNQIKKQHNRKVFRTTLSQNRRECMREPQSRKGISIDPFPVLSL